MTRPMNVKDVMETEVVTVHPDMSVRELTRVLSDFEISGAPVVDDRGETVGVVSGTDVLRLSADEVELHVGSQLTDELWDDEDGAEDFLDDLDDDEPDPVDYFMTGDGAGALRHSRFQLPESQLDEFTVRDIMTPATFTVAPDTSVRDLAEFLLRGRIHRALVMEEGTLLGIVTTFDVLRAVLEEE